MVRGGATGGRAAGWVGLVTVPQGSMMRAELRPSAGRSVRLFLVSRSGTKSLSLRLALARLLVLSSLVFASLLVVVAVSGMVIVLALLLLVSFNGHNQTLRVGVM
jgi:hypothetical protein